jgi:hypothetical protein
MVGNFALSVCFQDAPGRLEQLRNPQRRAHT